MAKYDRRHIDPIDIYIGKRIKLRRINLGLSQEAISLSVGVTRQMINKFEKGRSRFTAKRLESFARALSCNIMFFFEGARPHIDIDAADEMIALRKCAHGQMLAAIWPKLDDEARKAILVVARELERWADEAIARQESENANQRRRDNDNHASAGRQA